MLVCGCKGGQHLNQIPFTFSNPDGTSSSSVNLQVASTNAERMTGLMYRKSMPENEGMIFIFPQVQVQSFWMKNTYIPLDMLFLDDDLTVIGILENVPVLNEQPRSVGKPGRYVIELNAGRAKALGIKEGSKAVPQGVLPRGA